MDRTERLLDLIAYLLNAPEAVAFADVQQNFPNAYAGSADAAIRKFERDKATLLELGIPLRYIASEEADSEGGYVIDRDRYYLPEINLDPEEMAVVFLAGTGVLRHDEFPYRRDLERALQKISLRANLATDADPSRVVLQSAPSGRDVAESLDQIEQAMLARKQITITYHTQYSGERRERRVDAYGLFCKQGQWSVVGYCHDRETVRVFSVHRIDGLEVNSSKPRSPDYELPPDFKLSTFMDVPPGRYDRHDPIQVTFQVRTELAWMANQHFDVEAQVVDDGWSQVDIETTHASSIVEWVLGLGPNARVTGPEEVVESVRASLNNLLEKYA